MKAAAVLATGLLCGLAAYVLGNVADVLLGKPAPAWYAALEAENLPEESVAW